MRRSRFRIALLVCAGLAVCTVVGLGLLAQDIIGGLPSLEELENPRPDLATTIYSADGVQLDQFYIHNRAYIPIDSIPKPFINALIATEDQKFHEHWGLNIGRMFGALFENVRSVNMTKQGASTITQQLARNLYLSTERTLKRKIREQLTAVQIERTYTKNEILEMYANQVYFGHGAYGIQVAAEVYFNKKPLDLTVDECAYLVGVLKAPDTYDAAKNPDRALDRRNTVLALMTQMGYISGGEYSSASAKPIVLSKPKEKPRVAGYFVEAVRRSLENDERLQGYNLYRDGLVIYTSVDTRIQGYAEQAVREHLSGFQPIFSRSWSWRRKEWMLKSIVSRAVRSTERYRVAANDADRSRIMNEMSRDPKFIDSVRRQSTEIQCGLVAIEPKTGYVKAMVGGHDDAFGRGLNHVTDIRRQPGSSFKPFVYASALENGCTPNTVVSAASFTYRMPGGGTWHPKGSGGGGMTLRSALKASVNTVAARLIVSKTSVDKVIALAKSMGIRSPLPRVPSIALGSAEVTPMEITAAYTAFPNDGYYTEPTFIMKIEDRYGRVIYEHKPEMKEVLSPRVAAQMVSMMRGVVDGGTAKTIRAFFNLPAAGKTGTTQRFADAWFIGYTPDLVAGVWVGFDDQRIKFTGWYGQGGKAAAPVWGRFMKKVYEDDRLPYERRDFNGDRTPGAYDRLPYSFARSKEVENQAPVDGEAMEIVNGSGGDGDGAGKGDAPPSGSDPSNGGGSGKGDAPPP